jgi:hypothetical protein
VLEEGPGELVEPLLMFGVVDDAYIDAHD